LFETDAETRAFYENALSVRVIQAADRPRPYEGDPTTKDTDGDAALLEALADEYAGITAPRERGAEPTAVGNPAVITSKGVRGVLENDPRLDDIVAEWEHFGNLTGDNDLGEHRLAAVLGSQHYGDHAVERFCAMAGVEVDTSRIGGRGSDLSYGAELADEYHAHMSVDQTTQAVLRFTRGDSPATVVARTSAIADELPVVGEGQVARTWSDTTTKIAREWRRVGGEFTVSDVEGAVDVKRRQVQRVLGQLEDAGYVRRVRGGDGTAAVFQPASQPGAGEAELPARDGAVADEPRRSSDTEYYTWNVAVREGGTPLQRVEPGGEPRVTGAPPAPQAADGLEPPG